VISQADGIIFQQIKGNRVVKNPVIYAGRKCWAGQEVIAGKDKEGPSFASIFQNPLSGVKPGLS